MAGVAGVLAVEILGLGNWITAQQWVSVAALQTTTTAGSASKLCVTKLCHVAACKGRHPNILGRPPSSELWAGAGCRKCYNAFSMLLNLYIILV